MVRYRHIVTHSFIANRKKERKNNEKITKKKRGMKMLGTRHGLSPSLGLKAKIKIK